MKLKFVPFGESPVDALVARFLERKGVDPKDIAGYVLRRSTEDVGTIEFSMIFDEEPIGPESDKKE